MPLVVVTGFPCSGKTHRAKQILQEFQSRIESSSQTENKRTVVFLPSHHASLDPSSDLINSYNPPKQIANPRDQIYNLAAAEKTARAEEFSAIKRAVNKNVIVIADAPNYIKGFRYQLWCEAKAAGTRSVVLHTAAREDECRIWNNDRLTAWGWDRNENENLEIKSKATGPKVGKDVLGDLMPESHTALYGDTVLATGSRSRSSSTGAAVSGDEEEDLPGKHARQLQDDTLTLKSLYIGDRTSQTTNLPAQSNNETSNITPSSQETIFTTPSSPPPLKSSLPYSSSTFTSLAMRYEPPSPFSRWDTPLFTVPSSDAHPPYNAIWDAIFPSPSKPMSKKALAQQAQQAAQEKYREVEDVKQHAATILPAATGTDALQTLEHATGDVVKALLAAAREKGIADGTGGEISFSVPSNKVKSTSAGPQGDDGATAIEVSIDLPMGTILSQPMLQRLRRKYTQVQRGAIAHGQGCVKGRTEIVEGFIRFLEREWGE